MACNPAAIPAPALPGILEFRVSNPARSARGVTLHYRTRSAVTLIAQILTLQGRHVATLPAVRGRGAGSVRWNARDDAGRLVLPGVYFAALSADGERRVRSILLLP
jgi:hypothetical protein